MFGTRIKRATAAIAIAFAVWLLFAPATATATERPESEAPSGAPVGVVFGEQYDPDLGLYYLRARYYSTQFGRFWSMDSWEGNLHNPVTQNKYTYGNSNPIQFTDPSGRFGVAGSMGAVSIAMNMSSMQLDAGFAALDASRRLFGSSKWLDTLFNIKGTYDAVATGVGTAGIGVAGYGAFKWLLANGTRFTKALKASFKSAQGAPHALHAYRVSKATCALQAIHRMFGSRKNCHKYWNELQDLASSGQISLSRDPAMHNMVDYMASPIRVNIRPGYESITSVVAEELNHVRAVSNRSLGVPMNPGARLNEELRAKSALLQNSDINWFDRILLKMQSRDIRSDPELPLE